MFSCNHHSVISLVSLCPLHGAIVSSKRRGCAAIPHPGEPRLAGGEAGTASRAHGHHGDGPGLPGRMLAARQGEDRHMGTLVGIICHRGLQGAWGPQALGCRSPAQAARHWLDLPFAREKTGGTGKENWLISDKESCKLTKINPTSNPPPLPKKSNPPLFFHHEMHWLDSGLCAGSCSLYYALKILVANRVNGLIHSLLNWIENLQWALLVLDQTQKKQVRAGQNVLGKIPLWMRVSLTVPIHCNNWNKWCTAPHPSSKAGTPCFLHRLPSDVDMTKNRDKMLPNLGAYLKSWFTIVLRYLKAEEIYVTVICYPGTEN